MISKKIIVIFITTLLLISPNIYAVGYGSCTTDNWTTKAELEYKYILNPKNYLINYGFGTTTTFQASDDGSDYIMVMYTEGNSCSGEIKGYRGENSNQRFSFNTNPYTTVEDMSSNSSYMTINQELSTGSNYLLNFYGKMFITSETYAITIDDSETSGDPFDESQNTEANINSMFTLGDLNNPCLFAFNDDPDSSESTDFEITFSDPTKSTGCNIEITTSSGSTYDANMNVVSENVVVDIDNSTMSLISTSLYLGGYLNDDDYKVGSLKFDAQSFYIYDNDDNLFE